MLSCINERNTNATILQVSGKRFLSSKAVGKRRRACTRRSRSIRSRNQHHRCHRMNSKAEDQKGPQKDSGIYCEDVLVCHCQCSS